MESSSLKRILKGPWLWIVLAVLGVLLALQFLGGIGGGKEIETSTLQTHIAKGVIKEITFNGTDQEITQDAAGDELVE